MTYEKRILKIKILIFMNFLLLMTLLGCENAKEYQNVKQKDVAKVNNNEDIAQSSFSYEYDSRTAIAKGDDGWVYYFSCEYEKGESEPYAYVYNAYNLKHKYLSDYMIKVVDNEGNFLYEMTPALPYLILDENCFNEIVGVMDMFNAECPTDILGKEQEEMIVVEHIDKEMLIMLFNDMIMSDKLDDGKYYYLPEADILRKEVNDGYSWQIGFFNSHGVILEANIEIIYEDEIYLSDIINSGNASEEQQKLWNFILDVESHILSEQIFALGEDIGEDIQHNEVMRLSELLQEIEEGSYYK